MPATGIKSFTELLVIRVETKRTPNTRTAGTRI